MSENNKIMTMSNFLTQPQTKNYLEKMLGNRTNQFITSLSTMVGSNDMLNQCDRASLMGCALKATAMDLPFDQNLGFAYAIPYKLKDKGYTAQFQMGAKGFTQLALRSGKIAAVNSMEVKEGEFKGRDMLGEPIIEWLPEEERLDKKIVGYMAGMKLTTGFTKVLYWTNAELEKHANKYSQALKNAKKYNKNDALWQTDFDAMAKKTVLKTLLSKYAPLSTEMQEAIKADQAVVINDTETGEEQIVYVDHEIIEEEKPQYINKEQILEIATLVGDSAEKMAIINGYGYDVINHIEVKDYENIINELKVGK